MTDTLAAALGRGCRVERELGQGGMTTVHLADDHAVVRARMAAGP